MVVLMEYAPGVGVTTRRKGEEEPGLFAFPDDGDSGSVPLSCRATKMRRLESAGTVHDVPAAAAVGTEGDVMMAEEPPAPSPGAAEWEKRAVAVYVPAVDSAQAGGRLRLLGQWRLRPWAPLNAGAEWIHNMLREADGRTVRAVLSSPQEEGDAGLALVPWGTAHVPAEANQASASAEAVDGEEDAEGTAAMDVEDEGEHHQTQAAGAGCGEGYLRQWPQHCLAPPPLPAVRQSSPAVWSW